MIKILKLYSDPQVFDPIEFEDGINLIIGEKVEGAKSTERRKRKTNGVGKSLSIEFINFCLFKKTSDSRVMRIPNEDFSADIQICLDVLIGSTLVTLIRTKAKPEKPRLIESGKIIDFESIDDAVRHLDHIYNNSSPHPYDPNHLSFRELIAPLIRDEDSEFKEILKCYDISLDIPPAGLAKPHLYFFDIEYRLIDKLKVVIKNIGIVSDRITDLKKSLTEHSKRKMTDVKLDVSALNSEVQKINASIEALESNGAYEVIQDDLATIDHDLNGLRTKQAAFKYEIKKILSLPRPEKVDARDVELVYNQFKEGLGEIVSKSLDQVLEFKNKIEVFQERVLGEKLKTLHTELEALRSQIRELEEQRAIKLKAVDSTGRLKDFKNSVSILNQKDSELLRKKTQLDQYEESDIERSELEVDRSQLFLDLDRSISSSKGIIESYNETIQQVHEFIMGNTAALFEIVTVTAKKSKRIVDFNMRIEDDGSHSVDRTKVFIYDTGLLINQNTYQRHPGFLIHDNIFDVDQDTLVQSLNYLSQKESSCNFQYILTLNRDKIEHEEQLLAFSVTEKTRATFTKEKQFLNKSYQEINLKKESENK